jgi:hypothetical protein
MKRRRKKGLNKGGKEEGKNEIKGVRMRKEIENKRKKRKMLIYRGLD